MLCCIIITANYLLLHTLIGMKSTLLNLYTKVPSVLVLRAPISFPALRRPNSQHCYSEYIQNTSILFVS